MRKTVSAASLFTLGYSLVGIACLVVIIGWIVHSSAMIRLYPGFLPMQFNTALGLMLCCIALALEKRRPKLALSAAGLTALGALVILAEYALKRDFGIDTFFVTPFDTANAISSGRMSPNTATALLCLGSALSLSVLIDRISYLWMLVIALLSGVTIILGVVPLIGLMAGIEIANLVWGSNGHTAQHTAIALLILGFSTIYQICCRNKNVVAWLPLPIFISMAVMTLSLGSAARILENAKFDQILQTQATNIARKSELELNSLYKALDRLALRWTAAGGTPRALWENDASSYDRDFHYLHGLAHADKETRLTWLVPMRDPKVLGYRLLDDPVRRAVIERAQATRQGQTSPILTLLSGEKGFLYINALYVNDVFDGLQIANFTTAELFGAILDPDQLKEVAVTIKDEKGEVVFANRSPDETLDRKFSQITNKNSNWQLSVTPLPALLADQNHFVSDAVFVAGLILTFLITLCSYLLIKWKAQNHLRQELIGELALAQKLNQTILNSTNHMIIASGKDALIHTFNKTAEAKLGYKAEEVIGLKTAGLFHLPGEIVRRAAELSEQLGRHVAPGYEVFVLLAIDQGHEEHEWTFVRKDGSHLPVSLTVTVLRDEENAITGFLGIVRDLTQDKENERQQRISEEKLKVSEERLHIASSGTSDGLWDWNVPTGEIYYSPRFMNEIGYEENELPHMIETFIELLHPDDIEPTMMAIEADHTQKTPYNTEYRLRHKNGRYIWFHARGTTLFEHSKPVRMTGFTTNIDKRKKAQEALERAHAELQLIFDNVNLGIWFKDDMNNILRLNKTAATSMGGKAEDFENKSLFDLLPDLAHRYWKDDLEVIHSGKPKLGIVEQLNPSNAPRLWMSTNKIPYEDKAAGINGVFITTMDVTELKNSEQQREKLVEQLTESNTELGRFAYVASHDMQEPLRMIANFGSLLSEQYQSSLDAEGQEYLQIMTQSARRMQQMINDLLEYARVGNDTKRFVQVDVEKELSHVLENLSNSISERHAVVTHDSLPAIEGNPVQIMRLFQNLVANGMKYQSEGNKARIHIGVEENAEQWVFSVKDNGIGMEEKYTTQIFEPFKRLHSWQEYQGTGIGLAVCKKIVENHGGTISVSSVVGEGSVFLVILPKKRGLHAGGHH